MVQGSQNLIPTKEMEEKMLDDVKCPYCGHKHAADDFLEMDWFEGPCDDESTDVYHCDGCERKFRVTTYVSVNVHFSVEQLPDEVKLALFSDPNQIQLFN